MTDDHRAPNSTPLADPANNWVSTILELDGNEVAILESTAPWTDATVWEGD